MNGLFLNVKLQNVECLNLKAQRYTHTLPVIYDYILFSVFEFANICYPLKCGLGLWLSGVDDLD